MSDSTGGGGAMSGVGWTLGAVGALAVGAANTAVPVMRWIGARIGQVDGE